MPDEPVKPIYVLHGTDTFLRDAFQDEIVTRAVGDADPHLCVTRFDATAELADVLDELRTLPFLAPRRVVLVRDADAFVAAYRKPLEAFLESPPSRAVLILTVSSWKSHTRLAKQIAAIGETRDCSPPNARGASAFVRKAAEKRGKKLAPDAASLLTELIGPDRAALDAEVEKLATFAASRKTIAAEDVARLVAPAAGPEAFALTNAVTAADPAKALKALAGMLTARGDEFKILGMIAWHLRRTLGAKQAMLAGKRPDVRMPPAQINAFLAMVRRRALPAIQSDFRRMIAADLAMKTGTDPTAAMQQLVVGLCSP